MGMEITCAEVGGLWFSAENRYYDDASPCGISMPSPVTVVNVEEKLPTWAIILIIVVVILALCFLAAAIYCMTQKNKYQQMAKGAESGKTGQVVGTAIGAQA